MKPPKFLKSKHCIAVVGLYRSGKTVFTTSFINHIQNHRPEYLSLKNGSVRITFDQELPLTNGFERFPYERYRFNKSEWPDKTKACFQYRCSFFRSDWRYTRGEVSLIDIPGERLADIPMAKLSYDQWSDWLERVLQDSEYQAHAQEFLATCAKDSGSEAAEIVNAYRTLLGNLYRSYRPIITPSTFLLRENGVFTGLNVENGDLSNSFAGLDDSSQFTPLPRNIRDAHPALYKEFEQRFLAYKNKIARPLFKMFANCNELAVLIDVTTLLSANAGMYNGNRALLEQLMKILSPGHGLGGVSLNLLKSFTGGHWRNAGISRIAVVATKADKVHDSKRDKLTSLVQEMADGIVDRYVHDKMQLDCRYFSCAAVRSTESLDDGTLKGRLPSDPENLTTYPSTDLPDHWPGNWQEGDYVYPNVKPAFPENIARPPRHLGMESIIEFLL